MRKKGIIIIGIVLLLVIAIAIGIFKKQSEKTDEVSGILQNRLENEVYTAQNYTITLSIPEQGTGIDGVNIDSLSQVPFWDWVDTRIRQSTGDLTIRVSKTNGVASFNDGKWIEYIAMGDTIDPIACYYPGENGEYTVEYIDLMGKSEGIKHNTRSAKTTVEDILFDNAGVLDAVENTHEKGSMEENDGHIVLKRSISTTPIFQTFGDITQENGLQTGDTIEAEIVFTETPGSPITITIPFDKPVSDISQMLYGREPTDAGNYHLTITLSDFDQTGTVALPENVH